MTPGGRRSTRPLDSPAGVSSSKTRTGPADRSAAGSLVAGAAHFGGARGVEQRVIQVQDQQELAAIHHPPHALLPAQPNSGKE